MEAGSGIRYEGKQQREPSDMPIDVRRKKTRSLDELFHSMIFRKFYKKEIFPFRN